MQLTKLLSCLLLLSSALTIALIPTVRAQYGLNIVTTGQPVGSVPTGTNVHLTFSVSWSNLNIGWVLIVGLMDIATGEVVPSATATGSPNACYPLSTGGQTPGGCMFPVEQTSGIEAVAFDFPAPSTPQTLHLDAAGYISSSQSDLKSILVSDVSPEISILVTNQAQPTTQSTMQPYTTPVTSYISSNVIYGHSTGLPPDATISSVTFTLEGDNLVTTFQVQGSITNAYGYTIGIKAKNSNNQYSDYMIAYSYSLLGTGANFYDGNTKLTTPIVDSTVSGSTWTASIPLSWINDLTDFLAETTIVQTVSWGIQLIDSAPPTSPGHSQFIEVNLSSSIQSTTESSSIAATTSQPTMPIYTTSTPSLQMPQPPATQSTNNTQQLGLALEVIVAIVLAAVFLYTIRKRQTAKKAEKVEPEAKKVTSQEAVVQTEKTSPSKKNFCIECGSELPSKSKFCNNCGTKQP